MSVAQNPVRLVALTCRKHAYVPCLWSWPQRNPRLEIRADDSYQGLRDLTIPPSEPSPELGLDPSSG